MTKIQQTIAVIEDDPSVSKLIETILMREGYRVKTALSASEGTGKALDPGTDLTLLDLDLPDADGVDIARLIRSQSNVPILIVTGRGDIDNRVAGLDAGADDYLTKPFNFNELCARVRSLLRRANLAPHDAITSDQQLKSLGLKLNGAENSLIAENGRKIGMTEREFLILAALMKRAGSVISRDDLLRQVAGRKWQSEDRSLDVHISHLRQKLKDLTGHTAPIKTVRGKGFIFTDAQRE